MTRKFHLPLFVFVFVFFLLAIVQVKMERPIIILERFFEHAGWIEIFFVALYGGFIAYKMQDPLNTARWRMISWNVFSIVFFGQLILGLSGLDKFLMTGKLHLPVPMMIIGGPLYRGDLSVMTLLFLSTVLFTGPAWCSQLCYFGAIDNWAAGRRKPEKGRLKAIKSMKFSILFLVILAALLLRWFRVSLFLSTILAVAFGIAGIFIILFITHRKGKMVHCLTWCPVGTVVNYSRFINPFRMYIEKKDCSLCNHCTSYCNYDALNRENIISGKPGITCTLCGDCIGSCNSGALRYRFFGLEPRKARRLYLFLTISLHAVFLALGRI